MKTISFKIQMNEVLEKWFFKTQGYARLWGGLLSTDFKTEWSKGTSIRLLSISLIATAISQTPRWETRMLFTRWTKIRRSISGNSKDSKEDLSQRKNWKSQEIMVFCLKAKWTRKAIDFFRLILRIIILSTREIEKNIMIFSLLRSWIRREKTFFRSFIWWCLRKRFQWH